VDGFLFKNKSPSCGIKAVRVYSGPGKSSSRRDGVGAFTREVFQRFYQLPVEDEGRLRNFLIREDFLSRIFTLSRYRKILEEGDFQDLVEFHTKNKLLIMAHSQIYSKELGRAISNRHEKLLEDIKHEYGQILLKTLSQPSQPSSNINVLQHAFGYFSKYLTREEKDLFFDSIQKYRQGRYPLLISQNLLRSWIIRFKNEYLSSQTFLQPYPEDLMEITMI
jgi:uncharacterized protein YbgA (DUF1722 family)